MIKIHKYMNGKKESIAKVDAIKTCLMANSLGLAIVKW